MPCDARRLAAAAAITNRRHSQQEAAPASHPAWVGADVVDQLPLGHAEAPSLPPWWPIPAANHRDALGAPYESKLTRVGISLRSVRSWRALRSSVWVCPNGTRRTVVQKMGIDYSN